MEILILTLLILAGVPQAAGREGTVTGTFTFGGTSVAIEHVYASAQPGFFDTAKEDVHVLLSTAPLSDDDREDVFALMKLAREGKACIIEVVINAEGTPISGSIFAKEYEGSVSVAGMHRFTKEHMDRKVIAGRLAVGEPHTFMGVTWQYDARFSAPIPRPPTPAELAEALASPAARAAATHVAAIKAGQLPGFLGTLSKAAADDYRGADAPDKLRQLRADLPPDSKVVGLVPQTDDSVLAKVEGHENGIVIAFTFRMIEESGVWKVGK